jgi:hypothetical protein
MTNINDFEETSDFLFYNGPDGALRVEVIVGEETVWLTEKSLAEVFGTTRQNVNYHINNVLKSGELDENSVRKEILHTADDGKEYNTRFYNLDMIIAVGYRIDSYNATQFRIWATKVLKEYLVKGFALDDERLKQGKQLFGRDYFDELLERIREIRASERRFYQKITDIYAQCSIDYDPNAPITHKFYATVQNILEYAITHLTAAEIIKTRASALKPNMGLTTWKNAGKGGKIMKSDVTVAKNYLSREEISELNRLVTMYLDFAELQAQRQKAMRMADWIEKLTAFLKFNDYDILNDSGKMRKNVADSFAEGEYLKFRVIQDKEYESDFDKTVKKIQTFGRLPTEKEGFKRLEQPTISKSKKVISIKDIDEALDDKSKFDNELKGILKVPKPPKQ